MKELIVYFSRGDENYVSGRIQHLSIGNTEAAAKLLRDQTGAELFKLEPLAPYSQDYSRCIEEAKADQRRDARPALKGYPDHFEEFDTIYLGYPNYWGTMPMAVFTFLEHFDFSGKTIRPFCTHEGSGLGKSESDIKRLCPTARVEKGLAIHGADARNAGPALNAWRERIDRMEE